MTTEQIIDKLERGLIVTSLTDDDTMSKINAFYKAKYKQWDIECTVNDDYTTFVKKGVFVLHDETTYDDVMGFAQRNVRFGELLTQYGIKHQERTERILMGFTFDIDDLIPVAESKGLTVTALMAEIRSKI